jgi:hypothetical protein
MLPNLVIIGAAKCGTTSLHDYLGSHPQVSMAAAENGASKELRFFWRKDWRDHVDWYARQFDDLPVRGEATPGYTYYPLVTGVPEHMHALIPDAKLIYLVRDPIDRIRSHWVQRYWGGDRRSFADWMREYDRTDNLLVCASRYATQLERYLRWFPPERLLVIDQHDLKHRRSATLAQVFEFLDLDPALPRSGFAEERNRGADKRAPGRLSGPIVDWLGSPGGVVASVRTRIPKSVRTQARRALSHDVRFPVIDPPLRARLTELLAPEVARLRALTGKRFASWSL